ncbi:ABC transporter ATP-binding protein/permease [Ancylobacter sp. GSK1Z-4-2]|uniref:ABC transporter ATP-binding protein/permease n=2 Tax=Ancylobacter mangrovi TaxID=2972472 RepID=A0A9X2PFB2_9HYPH|nr:ABC transporter ATP-binding protein [Ancylobacter mangrovi]MCS0495901.1 ABC transporter ATP-binding protein/permease [Ancylobacter mangrovi]MCS0504682.1 ABC transporter ATP-binding protein/permease [Ancylobacter mangrovi]
MFLPPKLANAMKNMISRETRDTIHRLFLNDGRRHWKGYAISFVFMGIMAGSTSGLAYLMGDVINRIFVEQSTAAIWILSAAVLALSVIKGFSSYGQAVTLARVGNRIVADNQKRVLDRLLTQDVRYFSANHTAEIMIRFNAGAQGARNVLNLIITSLGRDLLSVVGLTAVMIVQDPFMALIGLIVMPIAVGGVRSLIRKVQKIFAREFHSAVQIMTESIEAFQGIRTIKSFTMEEELRGRIYGRIDSLEKASNRMIRAQSQSGPLMEALGGVAIGLVVMYAGWGVLHAGRTPGEFFSVITALLLSYEPAKRLARLNIDMTSHLLGARMLFEILDMKPVEQDPPGVPQLQLKGGQIEFDDVFFGYRQDEPVLRGLTFVAEAGKTTALVGPSGGGKSTVMNLIERFYEVESGTIAIDGQKTNQVSLRSLREAIGFVSQDVFLFSGTIRENIAFGRPGASEEDIVAAAKAAHAHDFIMSFAGGYNSRVGEHGAQLSGGQRQRIAIARAFLKDAPILLLDEATAALDSESEAEVQRALRSLQMDRTTLVIAHRLQTVVNADRIFVIDGGRVVESGRHDELVARRGRYYTFHQLQFAGQQERLSA